VVLVVVVLAVAAAVVGVVHLTFYPNNNRYAQSSRRKFQMLFNQQSPTDDPDCPPHVREAKRRRLCIEQRSDAANLGEDA
jgi:hypothetical protein